MELRDAIALFIRRRVLGIVIIVAVVGGSYLWVYVQPVRFTASVSFAVNRVNKQQTAEYQYDGYYALQASDLFAQTVVSWLQTPSVLVEIYDQAGVATSVPTIRSLTSRFKTKKYSAQNIVVTYSSASEDEGKRLASEMTEVIGARTAAVNRTTDNQALFEVQSSKPVIVEAQPNPLFIGIASIVVGVVLALFLVPFVDYLAPALRRP